MATDSILNIENSMNLNNKSKRLAYLLRHDHKY